MAQIALLVAATLALLATGYFLGRISSDRSRKRDLEQGSQAIQVRVSAIEKAVGVMGSSLQAKPSLELFLQNLDFRLSRIHEKLRSSSQRPVVVVRRSGDYEADEPTPVTTNDESGIDLAARSLYRAEQKEMPASDGHIKASRAEELRDFYNRALENRQLRDSLWQKYKVRTIGNSNASEQRIGEADEPVFQESDAGNMYAIEEAGSYLVVPKFDFTIKPVNYESTIRFVFDCSDFDGISSYSRVLVKQPAVFVSDGKTWTVKKKGELTLAS